jgi:putative PEP-CTERM system TPR-repeat lipoprotein
VLDQLARLQFANGDNGGAMETFTKLTVVTPRSAEAHFLLGSTHLAMNNLPAASTSLKRALSLQTDFLEAQMVMAGVHLRQRQYNESIALARAIQKQKPAEPVGYVAEADVLMVTSAAAAAVPLYEKAYSLSKSPELLIKVAQSLAASGRVKEAEAKVVQWRREHPADLKMAAFVAERHLANKNFQFAIPEIEAILKKKPGDAATLNNLANAYDGVKDPRALATAEAALKASPSAPAIMDTLGWMLVERNELTRGVVLLQKASAAVPNDADIRYHLIQALVKTQDMSAASKEFEQLELRSKGFPQLEAARKLVKK